MAGLTADATAQSFQSLADTLQDAAWGRNQQAMGTLIQLGINLKRTKTGALDVENAMYQLADKIKLIQSRDPAAARRLADSMGVGAMLPLLMQGGAKMREYQKQVERLRGTFTPDMQNRATEFTKRIGYMHAAMDGMKMTLADKLIPVFQPLIDKWTQLLTKSREPISDKIVALVQRLADWLMKIDVDETIKGINKFLDSCGKLAAKIDEIVDKLGGWENTLKVVGGVLAVGFVANIGIAVASIATLITKVGLAVGSLGNLKTALMLGRLGLLGAVGYGAYEGATALGADKAGAWMGEKFYDWMHPGKATTAEINTPGWQQNARQKAIEFFMKKGLSFPAAVGMAVNIQEESGFNPNIYGKGQEAKGMPQEAYGLIQAHPDRQKAMGKFLGKDFHDASWDEQLEGIWWELNNSHKFALNKLKSAQTPEQAAFDASLYYEVAGGKTGNQVDEASRRAGLARDVFNSTPAPNVNVHVNVNKDGSVSTKVATDHGVKINNTFPQ